MVFSNMSVKFQEIVLDNHLYILKWLVFIVLIFLSCYYVFVVWKQHDKTKYFSQAVLRLFLYGLSLAYLFASPLTLLLMSPEYSFYDFYLLPLNFYKVFISIIFLFVFVDFVRYGVFTLLELAGLDMNDGNVKEIASQIRNNKHFMKFGKDGRR